MVTSIDGRVTASDLAELVRSRRSIRFFRPDPVPREVVRALLADVLWAPSPHNAQPCRFTVLFTENDRRRLAEAMALRLEAELAVDGVAPEEVARQADRSCTRILSAPCAILCSLCADGLVPYSQQERSRLEWAMAVQSVGAALQTLFLLAHARDLGTCWMAAPMYCQDAVRGALDLPATWSPQALVLMGFAGRPGKVRPRRDLDQVLDLR